jgi:hypothetical protein
MKPIGDGGNGRILIGICSCRGMRERRDAVRDTWMRRMPARIEGVFFVGDGPSCTESDVVCLAVPDGYDSLSVKVHSFYRYALDRFAFDYLFKCDDDTYVHVERLKALARPAIDFVGSREFESQGFASGGAGYLMSRSIVEHFISEPVAPRCDEDVVFSGRVRRDRARWATTDALHGLGARFPDFANDMVTGHWCPPAEMRRVHAAVTGADHGSIVLDLRAVHRVWSGVIRLFADGVFWSRGPASPHGTWQAADGGKQLLLRWHHWPADALHLNDAGFAGPDLRLEFSCAADHSQWSEVAEHA